MIKSVYTGYELAMSAAGECNLYSASEGQTTFNLEKGKTFLKIDKSFP